MLTGACHTKDDAARVYEDLSSVVGPEGKKISFFEDARNRGKNIPIALYPTLIFQPLTFTQPTVIRLDVQKMSFNTLPAKLIPVSGNTCKWTISSANPVAGKPMELIIPFEEPDTSLWLENYRHRFKLYKISKEAETTQPVNWERIDQAVIDTVNYTMTAAIQNFEYGYCVVFEEIRRSDNIAIKAKGEVQAGVATDYFSGTNSTSRGFHYRQGISRYYYEGFWNENFAIYFSFPGDKPGTYTGNQIKVNYSSKKNNQQGLSDFQASNQTSITVKKYGKIGEPVEGTIGGDLINSSGKSMDFTMDFKLIRTR
jgi:hypothetical protein